MTRYAALLRGMNVGKHRRASSAQLCDAFRSAGFTGVATFRTAGNVVFSTSMRSEAKIRHLAEGALETALGHDVTVFVRSERELRALVDGFPFRDETGSRGKPQVVFLLAPLDAAKQRTLAALATDADRLQLVGRDICWWPKGSILDTGLDWNAIAKVVGPTTTRTFGTVELLAEKLVEER